MRTVGAVDPSADVGIAGDNCKCQASVKGCANRINYVGVIVEESGIYDYKIDSRS